MALITSRPYNPKPQIFAPLNRITRRLGDNVAPLRPSSQLSFTFPKFGFNDDTKPDKALVNTKLLTRFVRVSTNNRTVRAMVSSVDDGRRIMLSDVVVKRPRNAFLGRKWNHLDMGTAGVVLTMHLLSLFAPFHFNWRALCVAFALYVVTGLFGITLSFHRQLSHRSFKLPKWLEYLFAYCGVLALQVGFENLHFHYNNIFSFLKCDQILFIFLREILLIG